MINSNKPILIKGDSSYDNRGCLSFINDLDLGGIKRFFKVKNFEKRFIRAWHAHKKNTKLLYVSKDHFRFRLLK